MKVKRALFWVFIYAFSLVIILFAVVPFLWTVVSSLKLEGDIYTPGFWPKTPTINNYLGVLNDSTMMGYFWNSVVISLGSTIVSTLISMLAAYGFSRYKFPGRNTLLYSIMFTRVLPRVTLLIPFFVILTQIGLMNTQASLMLVYLIIGMPVSVWLMKGYIDSVPYEVEEAANIDGCGPIRTLVRVVIPMIAPSIAAIAMYSFILAWNEFLFPRVLTTDPSVRPISVGLAFYIDDVKVQWGMLMAASVIMSIPAIIVFSFAQKYIVRGLSEGAVKG